MRPRSPRKPKAALDGELDALVATLQATGERLEELTGGEVDSVSDSGGRTLLLRGVQERLRAAEILKKIAILNALPAHIAMLNALGTIVLVNEAWRTFGAAGGLHTPRHAVGVSYLAVCDQARGAHSAEAADAARGIRAVLDGNVKTYSLEYPCHSPSEQRWFLMTVTPLAKHGPGGAVVMHLNITAQRIAADALRASMEEFRSLAESMPQIVWITRPDGSSIYSNRRWTDYTGLTFDESLGEGWTKPFHPEDRAAAQKAWAQATASLGTFSIESRVRGADGAYRWFLLRGVPLLGEKGETLKWFGTCTDIHDAKLAEEEIQRANRDLQESERRFTDLLENVDLVAVMLDREARVTYCNDFLLRLTGWRHDEVMGKDWYALFVPTGPGGIKRTFDAVLANQPEAMHRDNEILTRAGERRLIRWNNSLLRSGAGTVIGTASIGEDITTQKEAEIRIRQLNRVYALLSGINTLIVRVRNRDELLNESCRLAVEAGGFRMAMICMGGPEKGQVPMAWAGKDEGLMDLIKDTLASPVLAPNTMVARAVREKIAIVSNDSRKDMQVLFSPKYTEAGVHSIAVLPILVAGEAVGVLALYAAEPDFFHEGELKLLNELAGDIAFAIDHIGKVEKLDYLAYYDELTGLANRKLFLERVAQYVRSAASGAHKLAVFMIDLERFRNVNDTLGRAAGDDLLRQIAKWLARQMGDESLIARVGADHFAIVMPWVREDGDLPRLVEKSVRAFLEHTFRLQDTDFRAAAKGGAALFPDDGSAAETLYRKAEAALKNAKASGERYLFYTQKMTESVAGTLTLETRLRQALEHQEFVLHYQPKVSLSSGKITGVEALIRWNDPKTGLVPPGRFIPVLEGTGLIHDVGRWALRQAVADYQRWRAAGLAAVRVAVNVSPLQLRSRDFVAEIQQVISVGPNAGEGLELEITESVIMGDVKHNIATLLAVRAMGVRIAIDDFGTGFSSLSYLAKLPVDTLKIDRSFVMEMTEGPQGLSLMSTIINLAHSLKLKAVAEGVETEEQARLLRLFNCDEMQGFLFSKPVAAAVLEHRHLAPIAA